MIRASIYILLLNCCFIFVCQAQYPISPNLKDEKGMRTGHWTILYDSLFHETHNLDSVRYYRVARFEAGKPVGKVRDFYSSRQKQWEGFLSSIDPDVFMGEATFYYENGKVSTSAVYDNNNKYNGPHKTYYLNGNLKSEGIMKNDTSTGIWNYYYENGPKEAQAEYKNGLAHGMVIYYYPSGKLKSKGMKIKGLTEGTWEKYYENGNLEAKENFKNDLWDGPYEKYNEDGRLVTRGGYKKNFSYGTWQYFFDDGTVNAMGKTEDDGTKIGEWKYFRQDGTLNAIQNVVHGKLHGLSRNYHLNGKLKDKGMYKDELKDSIWTYFYENEKMEKRGRYDADSSVGKWEFYHENGKRRTEGSYIDNKRTGEWKYYDENGKLSSTETYKLGLLHGDHYSYHPDGKLKGKDIYKDGVLDGFAYSFFENGKKEKEETYVNGKLEGKNTYWYDNGQLSFTGQYDQGKRIGEFVWYFRDGQISEKYNYVDDLINSDYVEFYENGNKKKEGKYNNGKKEGFSKFYTRNGNVYSQGSYLNNEREGKWFFNDSLSGKKESEGVYSKGNFNGEWTFYDSLGIYKSTSHYINGFFETADNVSDSISALSTAGEYEKALAHIEWLKKVTNRDKGKNSVSQATPFYHYSRIYYSQGKYEKSLEAYKKYGEITKKYNGDTVNNYAVALNGIAINLVALKRQDEAMKYYDQALKIHELINGRFSKPYITVLTNKTEVYIDMGKSDLAEEILKRELKAAEEKFGVNDKRTFRNIDAVADFYSTVNNQQECYNYSKKLVDAAEKERKDYKDFYITAKRNMSYALHLLGRDKEALKETTSLLNFRSELGQTSTIPYLVDLKSLAVYYSSLNKPDTSKMLYETILIATAANGWQNSDIEIEACYGLAIHHVDNLEYARAFELYPKVIKHYESAGRTNSNLYANIMHAYGYALYSSDKSMAGEALKYYKKSSELKKKLDGENDPRYIESLINLGGMYINTFQYAEAESNLEKALSIATKTMGKDSYYCASSKMTLATLRTAQARHREALQNYHEANKYFSAHLEEYLGSNSSALSSISSIYSSLGKPDSAEYYIRQAIDIYKTHKGENNVTYLVLNNSLASILMEQYLYTEAEKIYLKNVAQYAVITGKESLPYAFAVGYLGYFYAYKEDNKKSKTYYTEYLKLVEKISGPESDYTLGALANLASINKKLENYKEAEMLYLRVNKMSKEKYGPTHPVYANNQSRLADIYYWQERYNESEKLYLQGASIIKNTYGNKSKEYADYQKDFAKLYVQLDKNKEAEEIYLDNVKIYATTSGKQSWTYINSLDDLSNFYVRFGQFTEAEKIQKEEIELSRIKDNKVVIGHKLYKYASLMKDWNRLDKADSLAKIALAIYESELERNNYSILNTHNLLGLIALNQLRLNDAEAHFQFCIDESKIKKEENTFSHGTYLSNMSLVMMEKNQYEKAEKTLQQAGVIFEKTIKKGSLNEIGFLDNYAAMYQSWGKNELAEKYWLEVSRKLLSNIKTNFYFMSDNEKSQFWIKNKDDFEYFNTFAMLRSKQNPLILGEMYNNQLATKGILLSTSNKIKKRILGSHDSTLVNDYHQWSHLKEILAKAYILPPTELKEQNINISAIEAEANKLEKNLNITSEDVQKESGNTETNWKSIQKSLSSDEAAVEIIRFRYFNKHVTDSVLYAALVITAETKISPQLIVLPNGTDLENKHLKYYKNAIQLKLDDENSYENYWQSIELLLKNKPKVYISLDGVYNSINLNTLRLNNGTYLIDNKNIKIVSNTRDILHMKNKSPERFSKATAMLFGFPKFFVGGKPAINATSGERSVSSIDRSGIAELPGTKVEIEKIETVLAASKWAPAKFIGEDATEEALKSVQNPRVLHIATHGLFVDESETHSRGNMVLNRLKSLQNPLLKVGLLLSGSANYIQDETLFSEENGLLTAYEAANLNLENTDLVILSACETGRGEIRNGEGVYGLQRAFQTAGAKAIIMSLWKVDDDATQKLMTTFYKSWMSGVEKQLAFKTAQMEIKKQYSNPYYWGAFVLVGN